MPNKKHLGQNWLKDRQILTNIAKYASIDDIGTALEVGPGLGTLTSALFQFFHHIIAIEYDAALARKLPPQFPGKNLSVIHANILDFDLTQIPTPYVAVGNIPYYITSPIIKKFLTTPNRPAKIVFLIQKEVAERIAATTPHHTILSLSTQIYAHVTLGPIVTKTFFTPPPKVDSQIIILTPHQSPLATEHTIKLIKLGFSAPRKKLSTNLAAALHLEKSTTRAILTDTKIPESARPADLSIKQWKTLDSYLNKHYNY
jgi:16S rRNA (adenine1518-N6/adenine1519-N6)-dimethyltransferase